MGRTKLVQLGNVPMGRSVTVFNERVGDRLPLVVVPSHRPWWSARLNIPTGVHAMVQKWGAKMGTLEAGLHWLGPWWRCAYLVTGQSCAYNAPVQNCPTKDNVMIEVDVTLVFSISEPEAFVYDLGATRFDELLAATVEEAIRGLVRSVLHHEVYELRDSRADDMIQTLTNQFEKFGVTFTSAAITNTQLPKDLAQSLEKATTYKAKIAEHIKNHEYQLKILNDQGDKDLNELEKKNELGMYELQTRKERLQVEKETTLVEANRRKDLAVIKANQDLSVAVTKAESQLASAKVDAEKNAQRIMLHAEGDATAKRITADKDAVVRETEAAGQAAAMENHAKAVLLEAEAESKAGDGLKAARDFELLMAKNKVFEEIAANQKIVISGELGDELLKGIVGTQI
eukprot:GFYU01001082.1.p1 GENE.GFYU01001082.1~~GFYU01001082.1.p1  ORF type:complete len:400 (+),score=135.97 GFYU01001082.1:122-1321(+)